MSFAVSDFIIPNVLALQKSLTNEELTEEMANLEGLMKDLSAITQHQFEC